MIHLKDNYIIDADPISGYVLAKRVEADRKDMETGEKKKQFVLSDQTYHRYLKDAFSAYLRRLQRSAVHDNDYTITEAVRALQGLYEEVNAMLKEEAP